MDHEIAMDKLSSQQRSLGDLINIVAYRIRHDLSQRLGKQGLDITAWPILHCLWEKDGLPQAQIGERLGLPGYTVSRGIDRLEATGLVSRRSDPGNRRVRLVFLTEAGRSSQAELVPISTEVNARVLGLLDDDEQRQLQTLLRKIAQVL
ncbi:MAG: MarR family winged helix-turn-helix transcriptional regulator [Betaproteobacteria bacterium]